LPFEKGVNAAAAKLSRPKSIHWNRSSRAVFEYLTNNSSSTSMLLGCSWF